MTEPGDGQKPSKKETDGAQPEVVHTDPPTGPKDAKRHASERLTDDELRQAREREFKDYSQDMQDLLRGKNLDEQAKTVLIMQRYPDKFDEAQIEQFRSEFMESIQADPELTAKFPVEEQVRLEYRNYSQRFRELLEEKGKDEDIKTNFRMHLHPEQFDEATITEFRTNLDQAIKADQKLSTEFLEEEAVRLGYSKNFSEKARHLLEKYGLAEQFKAAVRLQFRGDPSQREQFQQKLEDLIEPYPDLQEELGVSSTKAAKEEKGDDESEIDLKDDAEGEKGAEDAEAYAKEQRRLDTEAREAMQASINDPLDVDKRRKAAEKIEKARVHHEEGNEHGADDLAKTNPWWAHALKGLGIAFYIFVALQWAGAAALDAYGGGGKNK